MATVRLSFSPAPVHVRTARLVGVAVARRAGAAEELLDEVRLAIGVGGAPAAPRRPAGAPGATTTCTGGTVPANGTVTVSLPVTLGPAVTAPWDAQADAAATDST